jgi:hypothetical protein
MCGDGNALGGKLRRLAGLCVAGGSSSGPSKSLRSGVGLLLSCTVVVVLFFALASGAFSLALNCPPGPCGGSVHLLGDIGMLSYVCFIVLVLIVLLRCLFFVWRGLEATLVTTLGGGLVPHVSWFTRKAQPGRLSHLSI